MCMSAASLGGVSAFGNQRSEATHSLVFVCTLAMRLTLSVKQGYRAVTKKKYFSWSLTYNLLSW